MIKVFKSQDVGWMMGLLMLFIAPAKGQQRSVLTLEQCLEWARDHYPVVKQYALIEKTKKLLSGKYTEG